MTDFRLHNPEPGEPERYQQRRVTRRTLVWRCCDCGRLFRQPDDMPLEIEWMEVIAGVQRILDGGESHGLCPDCLPKWERQIEDGDTFEAASILVNGR